jgi:hypothetical protein
MKHWLIDQARWAWAFAYGLGALVVLVVKRGIGHG